VSREHLSGRLPAWLAVDAPIAARTAASLAAAHPPLSSPRLAPHRPSPAPVRTSDAFDQPATVLAGRPHRGRALGRGSDHRQGPTVCDRHTRRIQTRLSSVCCIYPSAMATRSTMRSVLALAICHPRCGDRSLGTREPRCTSPHDHRGARRDGLLLRLALAMAARLEREHHRSPARLLPDGHRPARPLSGVPVRHRERAQQPTPTRPRRSLTDRPI